MMLPSSNDTDAIEHTRYQLEIMEGVILTPEQPEPLTILRRLRRFNSQPWSGGYLDQPWILMAELNEVIEAEIEYDNLQSFNKYLAQSIKAKNGVQES